MTILKLSTLALSLTASMLLAGATNAIADPSDGSPGGRSVRARVVVPTSFINKVSASFDVADTTCNAVEKILLSRRINNTSSGTVAVHFTAEFFGGALTILTLKRNGVVVPGPGDVSAPMAAHDTGDGISMNGFNWAVANVPAGLQLFTVHCSTISGTSAIVDERSLLIYHR